MDHFWLTQYFLISSEYSDVLEYSESLLLAEYSYWQQGSKYLFHKSTP